MKNARNRYLADDQDDFIVSNRDAVINILLELARERITVSGAFNGGREVLLTGVLGVDAREGKVFLDINANEERNQQFLKSPRVIFSAQANGARIQWSSMEIESARFEGGQAFAVPLPASLQRIQRRTAYRVNTPITNPVICHIPVAPDREVALVLADICVEGIGVILSDPPEPEIQKGARFGNCWLEHENLRITGLSLSVQSTWAVTLKNGHESLRAGLEFADMRPQDEPVVQRFVYALERQQIAVRKGH